MGSLVLSMRRGNRCDVERLGGSCGRAESRLKSLVRMGARMKVGGSSGCWGSRRAYLRISMGSHPGLGLVLLLQRHRAVMISS